MSLLITIEKLYFMDGIYRVTAQTERTIDLIPYISNLSLTEIKPVRCGLNPERMELLKDQASKKIAREYNLVTSETLFYGEVESVEDSFEILTYNSKLSYPDYREAIEGVEGVYLTD